MLVASSHSFDARSAQLLAFDSEFKLMPPGRDHGKHWSLRIHSQEGPVCFHLSSDSKPGLILIRFSGGNESSRPCRLKPGMKGSLFGGQHEAERVFICRDTKPLPLVTIERVAFSAYRLKLHWKES
jgi:hypothetical protein